MANASLARPLRFESTPWLQPLPAATRLSFCGDTAAQSAAAAAFGVPFSATACRAMKSGTRAALWLGPDEQLLLAASDELPGLLASLEAALSGHAHSLVDISHRQLAFELRGPHAAWLLNAQCPLDLSLRAFPVDMCTRTVFSKAQILLWRTASDTFRVEVSRSLADYVITLLREVAAELPGQGK